MYMSTKKRSEFLLLTSIKGTNFHDTRREFRDGRYTWISASGVWNYYWYISNNILLAKFRSTVRKLQIQNTPTVVLHRYHKSISPTPRKTRKYPTLWAMRPKTKSHADFYSRSPQEYHPTMPMWVLRPSSLFNRGTGGERQPNLLRLFPFQCIAKCSTGKTTKSARCHNLCKSVYIITTAEPNSDFDL